MSMILEWIKSNPALITAGILIMVRFIESGLLTKKWDFISLIKEFFTLR